MTASIAAWNCGRADMLIVLHQSKKGLASLYLKCPGRTRRARVFRQHARGTRKHVTTLIHATTLLRRASLDSSTAR
jgi:hypothetical protein